MRFLVYLLALISLAAISALGIVAWTNYQTGPLAASSSTPQAISSSHDGSIRFEDLAQAAGIRFVHVDGRTPMHYAPEAFGAGAAWLDFDQDGLQDLLLVQSGKFPPDLKETPAQPTTRLFRNQGDGTFVDVTSQVGIDHKGYGMGVAIGDYDNDGFPDLFLTSYGGAQLYHNEPDGHGGRRFRDVTRSAGIQIDGWCTSCAFADLHGNGLLDLFVCRYVKLDLDHYPFCGAQNREPPIRILCGPREFPGTSSVLFRNNGDGTFTDVSKPAGIEPDGKGLGVVILDLDADGKPDIMVGNDEVPNFHYRNLGGGKFDSCGVRSGTAANWQGKPMGSMGVEADDLTGHGKPDLFITTFYHQGWTLYRNQGNNFFTDISQSTGMFIPSWDKVGWGTCLLDADNDGLLDIFVANGHVYRNAELLTKSEDGTPQTYEQTAQLFRGDGKGYFQDISQRSGPYFLRPHVGRGVAMADYDNDGHMDLAINHCGGQASLLHNETTNPGHWVRLQLEGTRHLNPQASNRDAIGATVTLKVAGRTIVRHQKGGGSYLSAHDHRLLIGLGPAGRVDEVAVRWPNPAASVEHFGSLAANQSYKLVEGSGKAATITYPVVKPRQ
jgi:hypothetical protein